MSIQEIARGVYVIKPGEQKKWQDTNAGKYISLFTKNRAEQWDLSLQQATSDIKAAKDRYDTEMELYQKRLLQLDKEQADLQDLFAKQNLDVRKFNATMKQRAATDTERIRQEASQIRALRQERLAGTEFKAETAPARNLTPEKYTSELRRREQAFLGDLQGQAQFAKFPGLPGLTQNYPIELTPEQKAKIKSDYDAELYSGAPEISEEDIAQRMEELGATRPEAIRDLQQDDAAAAAAAAKSPDLYEYKTDKRGRRTLFIRDDVAEGVASGRISPEQIAALSPEEQQALIDSVAKRRAELVAPTFPTLDLIGQARQVASEKFGTRLGTSEIARQLLALPPELRNVLLQKYEKDTFVPPEVDTLRNKNRDPSRRKDPEKLEPFIPPARTRPAPLGKEPPFGDLPDLPKPEPTETDARTNYLKQRHSTASELLANEHKRKVALNTKGGQLAVKLYAAGVRAGENYDDLYRKITKETRDQQTMEDAHSILLLLDMQADQAKKPPTPMSKPKIPGYVSPEARSKQNQAQIDAEKKKPKTGK